MNSDIAVLKGSESGHARLGRWRALLIFIAAVAGLAALLSSQRALAHDWVHPSYYHYLTSGFSPNTVRPGQGTTLFISYAQKYRGYSHVAVFDPWGNRIWCSGSIHTPANTNRTISVGIGAPGGDGNYEYHAYIVAQTVCPGPWNGYAGAFLTVDGTPPAPPTITKPAEGELLRSSGVTVQGRAEAGSTVRIRESGQIIGTAATGSSGDWVTAIQFEEGQHTINATAVDRVGNESSPSANRTFTVKPEADPPTNVYALAGNRSAKVSWEPPLNSGNSPIINYTVTSSPDLITVTLQADAREATVGGLTNGQSYRFFVTAENSDGVSASSVLSNPVTPYDPNQPPPSPADPHAPIYHSYGGGTKSPYGGEPVNLATGNLTYDRQDVVVPGYGPTLEFSRSYNSREPVDGPLGFGWNHSYGERLLIRPDRVVVVRSDGRQDTYLRVDGALRPTPDVFDVLAENQDGTYSLTEAVSKTILAFDAAGRFTSIRDRHGNILTVSPSAFDSFNDFGFNQKFLERFESSVNWTAERGEIFQESARRREGSAALRLTNASATRSGLGLDLWEFQDGSVASPDDFIAAWVYVENHSALRSTNSLTIAFKTKPDAYLQAGWNKSELSPGWNRIVRKKRDFVPVGETPDWADITGLSVEVWPEGSNIARVVVDDLRMVRNGNGVPVELNPTYETTGIWEWDGRRTFNSSGEDSLLIQRGSVVTDGTVSTQVKYEFLDSSSASPGLVARHRSNGFYSLRLEPTRLVLEVTDQNGPRELASTEALFAEGQDYWLRLRLEGSSLSSGYSIDGITFLDGPAAEDSILVEGAIGLLSKGGGRNSFDDFGMLNYRVTAAGGQFLEFERASSGRVAQMSAPGGRTMTFAYDESGNLTRIEDFAGGISRFGYNEAHQMTSMISPAGRAMLRNAYDDEGRVISQKDGLDNELRIDYDSANRTTTLRDARGNSTVFAYDENFLLISETDPSGGRVQYSYDPTAQFNSVVDKRGNSISFDYGGPRLNSVADPTARYEFAYDADENLIRAKNALGQVTSYEYNSSGLPLKAIDPMGNVSTFEYDERGLLIRLTDPHGGKTIYEYDALGRLTRSRDVKGNQTAFAYDEMGNTTSIVDPRGGTSTYTYDALSRPLLTVDAAGNAIEMKYDADGNLTRAIDAKGSVTLLAYDNQSNLVEVSRSVDSREVAQLLRTRYDYDEVGNRTRIIDPSGKVTRFVYDSLNRPIEKITPTGARWQYRYDANGNQVALIDPTGNQTVFEYDDANRLVTKTDPLGGIWNFDYDQNGSLLNVKDPEGGVLSYQYDLLGRVIQVTDEVGAETRFSYDSLGRIVGRTDALGQSWRYSHDALGLITQELDPLGNRTTYDYDEIGNLVGIADPNGHRTTMSYDAIGQLIEIKDALDGTTRFEYDANGNRTAAIDTVDRRTEYQYDELDRLVAVVDALGQRTSYAFDLASNLIKVTDPSGRSTSFEYDDDGRQITITDPLNRTRRTSYDAAGRIASTVNGRGQETEYSYNARGELTRINYPDRPSTTFSYDLLSRRTAKNDEAGKTSYTYDPAGRLASIETEWEGLVLSYARDSLGQVTRIIGTASGRPYDVYYEYDPVGRLAQLSSHSATAEYSYDAAGNIVEILLGNGTQREFKYDPLNRITEIHNFGLTNTDEMSALVQKYAYDAVGNTIQRRTGPHLVENFSYDSLNRLVQSSHGAGTDGVESYTYDSAGNRVRQVTPEGVIISTFDSANQLVSETGLANSLSGPALADRHVYDADGNRISSTSPAGVTTYQYDSTNRVTQVSSSNETTAYTYDGDGNRIRSTGPVSDVRYSFAEGDLIAVSGGLAESYVWGAEGLNMSLNINEAPTYFYGDAGGSINLTANGAGAITSQRLFDPFGNAMIGTARGSSSFGFLGTRGTLDETSSLGSYQMGARAYDPRSGSFLSADSIMGTPLMPQSFNRYAYAFNNPFVFHDATGNWPSFNNLKSAAINTWNSAKSGAKIVAQAVSQTINRGLNAAAAAGAWIGQQVNQKIIQPAITAAQTVIQKAAQVVQAVKQVLLPPPPVPTPVMRYDTVLQDGRRFNPNTGSWEHFSYETRVLSGIEFQGCPQCQSLKGVYGEALTKSLIEQFGVGVVQKLLTHSLAGAHGLHGGSGFALGTAAAYVGPAFSILVNPAIHAYQDHKANPNRDPVDAALSVAIDFTYGAGITLASTLCSACGVALQTAYEAHRGEIQTGIRELGYIGEEKFQFYDKVCVSKTWYASNPATRWAVGC